MVEVLKQDKAVPMPFEKQVAIIFLAGSGVFDDADKSKIAELEAKLFAMLDTQYAALMTTIRTTKDLSDDSQKSLKEAAAAFKLAMKELFLI